MATLENLLQNDPFYRAGLINLKNVRSFEDDPRLHYKAQAAPLFTGADPEALAKEQKFQGYTYSLPDELLYVKDLNNPTIKTAGTVTHEGIHRLFNRDDWDMMTMPYYTAKYADSALGPAEFHGPSAKRHEELLTRYLVNQIYGEDKPFYSDVEEIDYATMMRPGQGPLGIEKLKKILSRRADPFLKKTALRAHRNIEAEAAQKAAAKQQLARAGAYSSQVQPDRPSPRRSDGPTWHGQTAAKEKAGVQVAGPGFGKGAYFALGGRINQPLPGRNRYI